MWAHRAYAPVGSWTRRRPRSRETEALDENVRYTFDDEDEKENDDGGVNRHAVLLREVWKCRGVVITKPEVLRRRLIQPQTSDLCTPVFIYLAKGIQY